MIFSREKIFNKKGSLAGLRRRFAAGCAAVLCISFFAGCAGRDTERRPSGNSEEVISGETVLTLGNGEAVYDYEYNYFFCEIYGDFLTYEERNDGFDDDAVLARVRLYKARAAAARAAGVSFSEEEKKEVYERASQFVLRMYDSESAVKYNAESADAFFLLYRGVNTEQFKRIYAELSLYEKYVETLVSEMQAPSEEELLAYYEENASAFRAVNLLFAYYSVADEEGHPLEQTAIAGKVRHAEEVLAAVSDDAAMMLLIETESERADASENCFYTYYAEDVIYPEFAPFCGDPALSAGDKTVVQSENGIYAIYCSNIEDFSSESVRSAVQDALILQYAEQTADSAASALF